VVQKKTVQTVLFHDLLLRSYIYASCLQRYKGSYYSYRGGGATTVDGRRLIAVANTLRALVLGGVHSTVASRANVFATNV